MKSTTKLLFASFVTATMLAFGLSGCNSSTIYDLNNRADASMATETAHYAANREKKPRMDMYRFSRTPVYLAVKKAAKNNHIKLSKDFIPSYEYRISLRRKMTLKQLLSYAYMSTGVKYVVSNGLVRVGNPKAINEHYTPKQCVTKEDRLEIRLANVHPASVLNYFTKTFGYHFDITNKYGTFSLRKKTPPHTPFFYKGCDPRQAIEKFGHTANLKIVKTDRNTFSVSDSDTASIEIPTYFAQKFRSNSTGLGGQGGQGGATVYLEENVRKGLGTYLSTHLSKVGKVYISNRGYATVTDRPQNVNTIRKLIAKEIMYQQPIKMNVTLVRVNLKEEYQSGIDWNVALKGLSKYLGMSSLELGIGAANSVQGGFNIGGGHHGKSQLISFMGKYGNTKIVRDYNSITRSGLLASFRSVDEIPYVVVSSSVVNGETVVTSQPKVAVAGFIINMLPTITEKGDKVNIATDITVSEYRGDKTIKVPGGEYSLPQISKNKLQMPAQVEMGKTLVLTGFKMKNISGDDKGIPGMVNKGILGTLFGSKSDTKGVSEFVILIEPEMVY